MSKYINEIIALILIILLLPPLLIVSIIIFLEDEFPNIYTKKIMEKIIKPFDLYKFRIVVTYTPELPQHSEFGVSHIKDDRFSHVNIRIPLAGFFNHSTKLRSNLQWRFIALKTLFNIEVGDKITVDCAKHGCILGNQL